ncbi:MAG: peptidase [bacterium]|nr:peptidase [bacterium]
MTVVRFRALALVCLMLAGTVVVVDAGVLSSSEEVDPLDIAIRHLHSHYADYGLTLADVAEFEVMDNYRSEHNGVTHVYLLQQFQGIPVFNGTININVTKDGAILNLSNRFLSDLANRVDTPAPEILQEAAIVAAAEHFDLPVADNPVIHLETIGGPTQAARFAATSVSRDDIVVSLMYQPLDDGSVRLAWRLVVNNPQSPDWWDVRIDAISGDVISQNNWTSDAEYSVIPLPADSPNDTGEAQVVVTDPANATASPFGWHDDNGVAGAEYTDTRGNNVWAQDDLDDNNTGGTRPDGGASLEFNHVWNPALDPEGGTNVDASVLNLFYFNNIMHDVTYQYGFDEVSGNFQENNYGNGGLGSDHVNADALDGSGTNNANFATPGDGSNPRMQMYRWTYPYPNVLVVDSPAGIAGSYVASSAAFGPPFDATGITADIALAEDGTGLDPNDGCEAITNGGAINGNIALIHRGNCNFTVKVANAQAVGAVAVAIKKITPGPPSTLGGDDPTITIPSGMISQDDGNLIEDELVTGGGTAHATFKADGTPPPDRDSDFDNGIIGHEYGHGISNRLVGGPSNTGCLFGSEQMGEGLSDFWTIVLSPKSSDRPSTQRGVGNYVIFQGRDGLGIRAFPYSTDMTVAPETFADIATAVQPHGVGSIWMTMAHEVYWELIARYGLDMDLYNGTGGNNLFIQLVVDAMKLVGCGPTFVSLRDAMLTADDVLTGTGAAGSGENQCEIWRGFAKRGLGEFALSGTTNVGDETEDFTVPAGCSTKSNYIFDDGFESGDVSRWSSN